MVSRILIQIIYVLGMVGLSITGIVIIIEATQSRDHAILKILTGLCVLTLGNLIWRIICEVWILLFNMHDILDSIERKLD
jgi:hypothetical protein